MKRKVGKLDLKATVKRIGSAQPGINILFTQILAKTLKFLTIILKNPFHNRAIIQRQLRFPHKIRRRSPPESLIQHCKPTDLWWVKVPNNWRNATLRQVPEAWLRRRVYYWVSTRKQERQRRTHLNGNTQNTMDCNFLDEILRNILQDPLYWLRYV